TVLWLGSNSGGVCGATGWYLIFSQRQAAQTDARAVARTRVFFIFTGYGLRLRPVDLCQTIAKLMGSPKYPFHLGFLRSHASSIKPSSISSRDHPNKRAALTWSLNRWT